MDQQTSNMLKDLIAENKLEEALDVMIDRESSKNEGRYHTLILLKGRLNMLEEQEMAGLLDLDELMQQKLKISHSLLKMLNDRDDDDPAFQPEKSTVPQTPMAASRQKYWYLIPLVLVVLAVGFFSYRSLMKNAPPPRQDQTETTTEKDRRKIEDRIDPPAQENTNRTSDKDRKTSVNKPVPGKKEDTERPAAYDQRTEEKKPQPTEPKEVDQPVAPPTSFRLVNFPPLNRPFNFSSIRYTFEDVKVEKYEEGTPPKIKLTLTMKLECRNNLGTCDREGIRLLVDGQPVAPSERKNQATWMENGSTATDELSFILNGGAEKYGIQMKVHGSVWERSFGILSR